MISNSLVFKLKNNSDTSFSLVMRIIIALASSLLYCASVISMLSLKFSPFKLSFNLSDGARQFMNAVFKMSEEKQNYIYNHFEVSANAESLNAFLLLLFIFIFAVLIVSALWKVKAIPVILISAFAVSEIYYGIAPGVFLNIALFSVMIVYSVLLISSELESVKTAILLLIAGAVIVSGVFAVLPKEYRNGIPAVNTVSESIRDLFDDGEQALMKFTKTEVPVPQPESESEKAGEDDSSREDANEETGDSNGEGGTEKQSSNPSRVYFSVANVVLIAAVSLLILAYLIALIVRELIRRRRIKSHDFDYTMRLSMKWLSLGNIRLENKMLGDYEEDIEKACSKELSESFKAAADEYQKLKYSKDSDADFNKIESFYNASKSEVIKTSGLPEKLKIKLIKMM